MSGALTVAALGAAIGGTFAPGALGDALPYEPGSELPAPVSSPPMDPAAPYTPTVVKLLKQLEPAQPDPVRDAAPAPGTTFDQLTNAAKLLHGVNIPNPQCTVVGGDAAPTGTDPAIAPLCWADAMGVNVTMGAQRRQTTAMPIRPAMSSTWDPGVLNAWGQVQGEEGRQLGITGLYGPQVDLLRIPAWGRNVAIFGEDPFQGGTMAAGEVNGTQGKGLMSQVKHFAMYDGQNMEFDTRVQDQAAHELYMTPFEYGTSGSGVLPGAGQASSMMCSYQNYELQPAPGTTGPADAFGPTGGDFACNNKQMDRTRKLWDWRGFFATDYLFELSRTDSILKGLDQEQPTTIRFGEGLVAAVMARAIPLSAFNRSLARILYQEERFRLLGHPDADSDYLSNSNPSEPVGKSAITPEQKAAHAAVTEKAAEESAVLLKNDDKALPVTGADLKGGVLVVGEGAEYMPAGPGSEAAQGYPDRDAVSPLEQLKQLAPDGAKISYLPLAAPTVGDGRPVPQSELSTDGTRIGDGLARTTGPGAPATDPQIDFTKVSGRGQLQFGQTYTWTGYINVPRDDDYTFHFQFSVPSHAIQAGDQVNEGGDVTPPSCSGAGAPAFSLAKSAGVGQSMDDENLASSASTLNGIPTNPTMSGYTERGLANCQYQAGSLSAGVHQIRITWTAPARFEPDTYNLREPGSTAPSFRFAYSRAAADRADVIAAAKSASKVLVFADCNCPAEIGGNGNPGSVASLDPSTVDLIQAAGKANANTAVVMNTDVAVLMPWLGSVKSVLETWYPGSEGGTATARLVLGQANPGGHLTTTWPLRATDTIFGYDEKVPLYAGDKTGTHPERLNSTPPVDFSEGIFVGYRFFDKEKLAPMFPFGYGLSYTTFDVTNPSAVPRGDGYDVSFTVKNTGAVAGATVPQIYVGAAPSVPAGVQQAERSLAGFERVELQPGQSVRRTIHIGSGADADGYGNRRAFQYWSTERQAWVTAPGPRAVWVGTAATEDRLQLATSTAAPPCASAAAFRSISVRPRGRGLRLGFSRGVARPVTVDVFRQSVGRHVGRATRVALFARRSRSVVWNGRPVRSRARVRDGFYFARFRIATPSGTTEVRRVALRRSHGRFSLRPAFYGRSDCGTVRAYKLSAPVFGGRTGRPLGIAFRVNTAAPVAVTVLRGGRVVKRFRTVAAVPGRTYRLTLRSRGLKRGDYRVRLVAADGTSRVTKTLTARRL